MSAQGSTLTPHARARQIASGAAAKEQ